MNLIWLRIFRRRFCVWRERNQAAYPVSKRDPWRGCGGGGLGEAEGDVERLAAFTLNLLASLSQP